MTDTADPPVPRVTLDRCSMRAALRGDPMLGTAFPASRLLLVEQPGPWGRRGLVDSRFGAENATALIRRAERAGVRVIGIRRPGRSEPDQARRWALVDTRDGRERQLWGSYDDAAELLHTDFGRGEPGEDAQYLVCTNGKRDACCAVRGRLVAQAFDAHAPLRTWECTHLGGDRFAANVLVLPAGLLYGRVLPMSAADFVAASDRDEVLYELLRGRVGLLPAAQAALASGYAYLGDRQRHALRVRHLEVDGDISRVTLDAPDGERLTVDVLVDRVQADGLTCRAAGDGWFQRYEPVSVTVEPR